MVEIKTGDFVVFYMKDGVLYPVALDESRHKMIQLTIPEIVKDDDGVVKVIEFGF